MFGALFRRAEATVDNAISALVLRLLVVAPFVVAAGFATAAASIYLNRELGAQAGYLVMASVFAIFGLLAAAFVAARPGSPTAEDQQAVSAGPADDAGTATNSQPPSLAPVDRELLTTALAAVGPAALPALARGIAKNLPLVAAVAVAAFVLSRDSKDDGGSMPAPAE
jgi:hypothetical protein